MGALRTRKNTNLNVSWPSLSSFLLKFSSLWNIQVIAGLLVPIYIKKLDFKTREELQQMPQTEEEHLENQFLDYEDKEKSITDAEVKATNIYDSHSLQIPYHESHLQKLCFSAYMPHHFLRARFKGARLRILWRRRSRHHRYKSTFALILMSF